MPLLDTVPGTKAFVKTPSLNHKGQFVVLRVLDTGAEIPELALPNEQAANNYLKILNGRLK